MSKRLTKKQILHKYFDRIHPCTPGHRDAALKAMAEYAAQQVKPWRAKVRKLHDENYRINMNW